MKKIAFIIRLFQGASFHGGGEKIFYKLITKLIENNFTIDIYCSKSDIQQFPGINEIIVVDKPYDHNAPVVLERFYSEIKDIISDKNYDYVISENIMPPVDLAFMQGHSVHHRMNSLKSPIEAFLYNFRKVKKQRLKYEKKWLNEGYRKIFVLSNVLKKDIMDNFDIANENITIVYPGVDIEEADQSVLFPDLTNKLITFGLSAPGFKRKGGFVLLEALGILKKKGYNFNAKIIYPKFKRNMWVQYLVKKYNIQNNVEFLPFQKGMTDFYHGIDALVMPSLEETFGLVAIEAMLNKKLSIVSSYCGASEVLKDEYDALVFDMSKNQAENLAIKLAYTIDNPEKVSEIIKIGFESAKIYSWDRTCKQFMEELTKL